VSRFFLGYVATRTGSVRGFQASLGLLLVGFVCWFLSDAFTGLAASAPLLGAGYDGVIGLTSAVALEIAETYRIGSVIGILYTASALGTAIGPPLAGVPDRSERGYDLSVAVVGLRMLLAGISAISLRSQRLSPVEGAPAGVNPQAQPSTRYRSSSA
jgi:MFS family permease